MQNQVNMPNSRAFAEESEKDAMKALLRFQGRVDTETLVAVPREEAIKLL